MGLPVLATRAVLAFASARALPDGRIIAIEPIAVCGDAGFGCGNTAGMLARGKAVTGSISAQAGSIAPTCRSPAPATAAV